VRVRLVKGTGVDVEGVDSAFLDCIADNVAVLLRFFGVADARTPFACQWHFGFDESDDLPLPAVERVPFEQLVARQTGLALHPLEEATDPAATCRAALERDEPVFAVGDSFLIPWLPYFGNRHMDHSFVVDGTSEGGSVLHVADAYSNRTQWGDAVPLRTELPAAELASLLEASAGWRGSHLFVMRDTHDPDPLDPAAVTPENAEAILRALREERAFERFRGYYAARAENPAAVQRFTLACWLVARSRALHALWLSDQDASVEFDEIVTAWRRVAEFAYMMERRVAAGRPAPLAAFELLESTVEPAEAAAAERLLEPAASVR
jgi:hypothetical protein